jgi:hypothetical protein
VDAVQRAIHDRWIESRNRKTEDPDYLEDWFWSQCGDCVFWFPITGKLGADWGACTNSKSPFDGRVRFEHDGCDEYAKAPEGWRGLWGRDHGGYCGNPIVRAEAVAGSLRPSFAMAVKNPNTAGMFPDSMRFDETGDGMNLGESTEIRFQGVINVELRKAGGWV